MQLTLYMLRGELPDTEVEAFNKALVVTSTMNLMLLHLLHVVPLLLYLICTQVL